MSTQYKQLCSVSPTFEIKANKITIKRNSKLNLLKDNQDLERETTRGDPNE